MNFRVARMMASGRLSYVARVDAWTAVTGETCILEFAASFAHRGVAENLAAALGVGWTVVS